MWHSSERLRVRQQAALLVQIPLVSSTHASKHHMHSHTGKSIALLYQGGIKKTLLYFVKLEWWVNSLKVICPVNFCANLKWLCLFVRCSSSELGVQSTLQPPSLQKIKNFWILITL